MTHDEILAWLRETDAARLEALWQQADRTRREYVGDEVHLRGLVEISNHCVRACGYCGLRAPNRRIERYRMRDDEVLTCADRAVELGYGTVVLQSGDDPGITRGWMGQVIRRIKAETSLAVTLSLGERLPKELAAWRDSGADRYLLKFETSNRRLYERIHPPHPIAPLDRLALLDVLRRLGYEVGSGVMIGVPGQSYDDLARDVELFRSLDLDMIGLGPYLPHPDTPLGAEGGWGKAKRCPRSLRLADDQQVAGNDLMTYKTLALARLACPGANIPATTALATAAGEQGRGSALARGANVVMPNLTPPPYRRRYEIYPGRERFAETPEAEAAGLRRQVESIGRVVGRGPGESPRYAHRRGGLSRFSARGLRGIAQGEPSTG